MSPAPDLGPGGGSGPIGAAGDEPAARTEDPAGRAVEVWFLDGTAAVEDVPAGGVIEAAETYLRAGSMFWPMRRVAAWRITVTGGGI